MGTEGIETIEYKLLACDGKSLSDLKAVYEQHCDDELFYETIIDLITNTKIQKASTWLLKHYFDSGVDRKISLRKTDKLLRLLPLLEAWEAKLHVLQMLPYLKISERSKKCVDNFLRQHLSYRNKFVRAWAYNGFYVLAKQYPEYVEEMQRLFGMALKDESASVKARIRKLDTL